MRQLNKRKQQVASWHAKQSVQQQHLSNPFGMQLKPQDHGEGTAGLIEMQLETS